MQKVNSLAEKRRKRCDNNPRPCPTAAADEIMTLFLRIFYYSSFPFFFPALRPKQPPPADVPGVQAEPPEDPEPGGELRRHHGGPQGAQAAHLAQPGLKQHQGSSNSHTKFECNLIRFSFIRESSL